MKLSRSIILLIAALGSLFWAEKAFAQCLSADDRVAHQVRILQTQMMVGALQCRGRKDLGQRQLYNQFVESHQSALAEHGAALISYFKREYGTAHKTHLDKHITRLANQISAAVRTQPDFCQRIAALGKIVRDGSQDLEQIVDLPITLPLSANPRVCMAGNNAPASILSSNGPASDNMASNDRASTPNKIDSAQ
ncbi:hypothetical protein JCM17846_27140 [Iodidimonas nitroreducens]|uniref:Uncharacterized protein n=1 Tax=Iodidimonas nitroreducens TaxID=1236968 RepID=A0A5A7N9W6_9PROT|nr:hypothetical protein [Iodidimonas nitroreducens]GAK34239.1 hypothetical protein AQ1_02136 [alpha proteobacterium Q-1]GER05032.1 hypothetical protein JCM17846_27140 [Iodidimonas nitroreducens]